MWTLGIESSCDDTSVALVNSQGCVLKQLTASQDELHLPFGGVVPEIAGRSHLKDLMPLIQSLLQQTNTGWSEINGVVATSRPGLVGSLIVGLVTAKTLSFAKAKAFLGIHHIEGHIQSAFLWDKGESEISQWEEPYIALVVSGGHTHLYSVTTDRSYEQLGGTVDDAAGEAFDKFAKMLGLGYPGGRVVDEKAKNGHRKEYKFPRSFIKEEHLNFSFSGLKASAQRWIENHGEVTSEELPNLCASYQEAIVEVLIKKLHQAMVQKGVSKFVITGGVSANSRLREKAEKLAGKYGYTFRMPKLKFCTDNASMIAYVGALRLEQGESSPYSLAPKPREELK